MMLRGELFGTDMVQAYLDGHKFHTGRPVKEIIPLNAKYRGLFWDESHKNVFGVFRCADGLDIDVKPAFLPGDFMYCRETWRKTGTLSQPYAYRASEDDLHLVGENGESLTLKYRWIPSIHMPRAAARLFFRVTKVEAMRLDDVTEQFAREDGFQAYKGNTYSAIRLFRNFWSQTYGPDAHWMWAYWTEPCSREEAEKESKDAQ